MDAIYASFAGAKTGHIKNSSAALEWAHTRFRPSFFALYKHYPYRLKENE